jgi:hypothetical protein
MTSILEQLDEAEKNATPGRWKYDWGNWEVEKEEGRNPVCTTDNNPASPFPDMPDYQTRLVSGSTDGEFIALMRNNIHSLIDIAKAAKTLSQFLKRCGMQYAVVSIDGVETAQTNLTREIDEALAKLEGEG